MNWPLLIVLFLHVFGAIVAFGPTYAFILLGPMASREPQHGNFALRYQHLVSSRVIVPLAILQGITGVLLIYLAEINLFGSGWLLVSITLYLIALAIAFIVLLPTASKLIEITSAAPPPPAPGTPPPAGPPPQVAALIRRARMAGMTNSLLVVVIVFLMVSKPF